MAAGPPSTARNSAENPQPLGAVIGQVKGWIERCGWIWVQGQVIELRRRAAPTQFLTLRDSRSDNSARITCSSVVLDAAGPLTEGMTVVACILRGCGRRTPACPSSAPSCGSPVAGCSSNSSN